jgi:hypothetical protein
LSNCTSHHQPGHGRQIAGSWFAPRPGVQMHKLVLFPTQRRRAA